MKSALAGLAGLLLASATAVLPATFPAAAAAAEPGTVVDCPRAAASEGGDAPTAPPEDPSAPPVGGEGMGTPGLAVPDGAPDVPTTISAASWVVADLDSGEVLGACAPHARSKPASTLKLLTALAALPKLDPKQTVTATAADLDIESGSSAVGLVADGEYSVETLALGLFLVSGNDAANTLARLAGEDKGLPGTIDAMNAQADRLGAKDTTAVNANGLDDPEQWSSSYDLALIARAAFDREDVRRYATTPTTQIPGQPGAESFQIQNDNQLLDEYEGAFGGKTGFTDLARHTFVGVAERGGRRLVVTLMRAEIQPQRPTEQAAALLDWGFSVDGSAEPVGTLVEPKSDRKQGANAAPGGTNALAGQAAERSPSMFLIAGLAALALVALLLVLGVLRRRKVRARNRKRRQDRRSSERHRDRHDDPERHRTDRHPDRRERVRQSAAYAERTTHIPPRRSGRPAAEPTTAERPHRSAAYREARRREHAQREASYRSYPERTDHPQRTRRHRDDLDGETQPLAPVGDSRSAPTGGRRRYRAAEADTEPRPAHRTGPSVGVVVVPGPEPRRRRTRR